MLAAAISADAESVLFSVKSFGAAVCSYYIALDAGLEQPVWAVTTVYLVSQPLAGAVVSKGLFRLIGTFLGGAAAVVFLPIFVDEPLFLSLVLSMWLGTCVYLSQLDRTPRSYVFLLAGYTTCIIGFPGVSRPGVIFDTSVFRVEEIGIAIVAASVAHGAILPRTVTRRLEALLEAAVGAAERLSRDAISESRQADIEIRRRRVATSVNEIEELAFLSAFDTARLVPPPAIVRAIQDQLSWVMPLSGAIEDRIAELSAGPDGLPSQVGAALDLIDAWLAGTGTGQRPREILDDLLLMTAEARREIETRPYWIWEDMLLINLLARLDELAVTHLVIRELLDQIRTRAPRILSAAASAAVGSAIGRSFHRDHGLALRSGVGAMVAVLGVCAFWIATAWTGGTTAAVIASISCALFGTLPQPGMSIRRFFLGSVIGILAAAFLGFAILPGATDFVTLAAGMAPILLLLGSMQTRRPLALIALGALVGLLNTGIIGTGYQADFATFANGAVAQVAATLWSVLVIDVFHAIGADRAFSRLLRAGFRDIAQRAEGRARDTRRWTGRMVDRIALINARSGQAPASSPSPAYDALVGMRIGYLSGEFHALTRAPAFPGEQQAAEEVLRRISKHFRTIGPRKRIPAERPLLHAIDQAITAFDQEPSAERRRRGVVTLTGLRRSLFPDAAAYVGVEHDR